jgi:hypothetical protein
MHSVCNVTSFTIMRLVRNNISRSVSIRLTSKRIRDAKSRRILEIYKVYVAKLEYIFSLLFK